MEEKFERIERFITACNELVEGKYISADVKMSEALAAIAASRELTELFTAVTQDFDYLAAKHTYLRAGEKGARGVAYLPSDRSELLAFVFCLFVEFDAGTLVFSDFLLRYFYVDGSYTASFTVFAERVVRPFMGIVRDCFPLGRRGRLDRAREKQDACIGRIAELLPVEQARLAGIALREEEKAAAELILSGLSAAVGRKDVADLSALLAGYRYFLRYFGGENETSEQIFRLASEL